MSGECSAEETKLHLPDGLSKRKVRVGDRNRHTVLTKEHGQQQFVGFKFLGKTCWRQQTC